MERSEPLPSAPHGKHPVSLEEIAVITRRLTPTLSGYVVLIAVGLFAPTAAVFGYLLIAFLLIVPLGAVRHIKSSG